MSPAVLECLRLAAPYLMPPAKPRTLGEFARTLRLPDGPSAGQLWDPDTEPAQRILVDAMASRRWRIYVTVAPSQRGKTLTAILLPWLYATCEAYRDFGYVMPNLDKLNQNWTGKLSPSIANAGFRDRLPAQGPGSKRGRPSALVMTDPLSGRSAISYFMAAGKGASETATAAVSAPEMGIDEADDFENVGQIELALRRLESFPDGRAYIASTVNDRGERIDHPVLDMFGRADATRSRLAHRCPHCQAHQVITRAHFDPDAAALHCTSCGTVWSDADRHDALNHALLVHHGQEVRNGAVVGSEPIGDVFSILTTGPDYHMTNLANMGATERAARDKVAVSDHSLARLVSHKVWCEAYTGDRLTDDDGRPIFPTRMRLAALSAASDLRLQVDNSLPDGDSLHFTDLPAWVEFQTLGVDVQRGGERAPGRLVWVIYGHGGGRGAVTAWGSLIASPAGREPTAGELYAALDRLDGILNDWAPKAPIIRRGVDVGDRQDELIRWILPRSPRWIAVKGTGPLKADGLDLPGWIYHRPQEAGGAPWWLHLVDSAGVIRVIHAELLAEQGKPGSLQLAHGLGRDSTLIMHLCSTAEYEPGKWSEKPKDRIHHPEWQARNDYLDAVKYARALAYEFAAAQLLAEAKAKAERARANSQAVVTVPSVHQGYQRRTTFHRRERL